MTGTSYSLEILHKCCKGILTKSQKVLKKNSHVCRSYPHPILNRVKRIKAIKETIQALVDFIEISIDKYYYETINSQNS